MSMRQVWSAELSGYGEPLFPRDEIRQLVEAFTSWGQAGRHATALDAAAVRCPGFKVANRVMRTADNYVWRRIIEFKIGKGQVAIAIPRTQDGEFRDGVMLDRSPAVYIAGDATEAVARNILKTFADVLHR